MSQRLAATKKNLKLSKMSIKRTDIEKIVKQLRAILATLEEELEPIEVPADIAAEVKRKMDARFVWLGIIQFPKAKSPTADVAKLTTTWQCSGSLAVKKRNAI